MSLHHIGVDVGGTNTDAALLDTIISPNITSGIESAIHEVLTTSAVDQNKVLSATIGTTHFINALRIILEEAPGLHLVCSHDIGPPGLLKRENATILNAAILRTAQKATRGFKRVMARLRLACPLYLSQNDGTLIDADTAAEYPIKTFASGPTNSMTGAGFLAGLDKANAVAADPAAAYVTDDEASESQILVVDIGGTTTDVCALLPSGFPRQAPGFVEIGGVRTAFSMPEVVSIGLGGGSKVD
ncbi:hypothetical protein Daus18300_011958, partial [Diaporthe australafricana]